jgi:hypothetical protein
VSIARTRSVHALGVPRKPFKADEGILVLQKIMSICSG